MSSLVRGPKAVAAPAVIGLSLLAACVAITNQSLWIDEANSAVKAMQPSLASWWHVLASEKGSDLQMPFYMLWLWAWEKFAGHSEFALRAANLPWLFLAHFFLFRAGRASAFGPVPVLLIASLNPFLWTYLDEARPYVMQYAAACVLAAFLFRAASDPDLAVKPTGLWSFVGGLLLLCGSSLLGVIWAAFAGAAWLFLIRHRIGMLCRARNVPPLAVAAIGLAGLGCFYLWTLQSGARASGAGRTGVLNLAFVAYELLGSAGWGPGRLEIRQHGLAAFQSMGAWIAPVLAASIFSFGLLALGLFRAWQQRSRPVVVAGVIYAVPPVVLLFALGYLQDFRILGRHFMPLTPVILGVLLLGLSAMRRRHAVIFGFSLCIFWLGSSLSLRLAERHRKDDYRSAARIAKTALARGERVWWSADNAAAVYYELPVKSTTDNTTGSALAPDAANLGALPIPDVVIASKPDIYDSTGRLAEFLRANEFAPANRLPAFTIWRRPPIAPEGR